jgi:antitoxin StbD
MSTVSRVMASISTSITDFKANPNAVIEQADGEAIAVLKSNEPSFYAVPPELYS